MDNGWQRANIWWGLAIWSWHKIVICFVERHKVSSLVDIGQHSAVLTGIGLSFLILLAMLELLRHTGDILALMESLFELKFGRLASAITSKRAGPISRPTFRFCQVEHPWTSSVSRRNKYHSMVCKLSYCCQPAAQIHGWALESINSKTDV